ncbi:MAG: NAD(P)H-dependent oxidoreductase [Deltaproteobacteria bacterium]|nr:NAD(P)H-dependent oxidoreductase [Deltaproteobacteria bacterium]
MSKNVVVILGHPLSDSFNGQLADAAFAGAQDARTDVQLIRLEDLQFDPILRSSEQALEPDLVAAQKSIEQAHHVVWVFPVWWATTPALLKGFIDRVFLKDWAFRYDHDSPMQVPLLKGRTSRVISTMDSPSFWYRWVYRRSAHRAFVTGTLKFCGFGPVKESTIYKTRSLDEKSRQEWLAKVREEVRKESS